MSSILNNKKHYPHTFNTQHPARAKKAPYPHLANLTLSKAIITFHMVSTQTLYTYLLWVSSINTVAVVVEAVGVLTTATVLL